MSSLSNMPLVLLRTPARRGDVASSAALPKCSARSSTSSSSFSGGPSPSPSPSPSTSSSSSRSPPPSLAERVFRRVLVRVFRLARLSKPRLPSPSCSSPEPSSSSSGSRKFLGYRSGSSLSLSFALSQRDPPLSSGNDSSSVGDIGEGSGELTRDPSFSPRALFPLKRRVDTSSGLFHCPETGSLDGRRSEAESGSREAERGGRKDLIGRDGRVVPPELEEMADDDRRRRAELMG
jgi:hypothetical protein